MFFKKRCLHDNVAIDSDYSYCPDCGELIENKWYLVRCACCGVKVIAIYKNGKIIPLNKFCKNCGCSEYKIERIEKIDCVNVNYAVLIKEVVNPYIREYTQTWSDTPQVLKEIENKEKMFLLMKKGNY